MLEENVEEKQATASEEETGGESREKGWGANRASFTEEETVGEGRKRKERLNKDAAKSETAGDTSARKRKGRSCSPKQSTFTRDINFSLKLARRDLPRGRDRLASKRHGRKVGTVVKHASRMDDAGGNAGEKEGGSGSDDGGRKVPWRNSLRVSMARHRRRRTPRHGDANDDLFSRVGEVITAGEATVTWEHFITDHRNLVRRPDSSGSRSCKRDEQFAAGIAYSTLV